MPKNTEIYRSKLAKQLKETLDHSRRKFKLDNVKKTQEYKAAHAKNKQKNELTELEKLRQTRKKIELLNQEPSETGSDVELYNTEPLPFETLEDNGITRYTWLDFDQDETGKNIFLYRGLKGCTEEEAQEIAHLSSIALQRKDKNIEGEDVSEIYGKNDAKLVAQETTHIIQSSSDANLHLTIRKNTAEGYGNNGVLVTFKIPKEWILKEAKKKEPCTICLGSESEQEIEFLFKLPEKFIFRIEPRGQIERREIPDIPINDKARDVLDASSFDSLRTEEPHIIP
jgi:hypothetical protein